MSSFCLVADVSCDLPESILKHPQLRLLPTHVFIGEQRFVDARDAQATAKFYRTNLASPAAIEGRSEPLTTEEMIEAFSQHLALNYDQVLGVFVASSRSSIYNRAREALAYSRRQAHMSRAKIGRFEPMQADCLDSQALFAGYGVQVIDLMEQMQQGVGLMDLITRQQKMAKHTYAYMVPGDVSYILKRAAFKGEQSISALAGFAAKTLSITPILQGHLGQTAAVGRKLGGGKARSAILEMALASIDKQVLLSAHICLSYSGKLEDISKMLEYTELCHQAKKRGVEVHLCQMSMTGSVNVGPDALCLGMLALAHEPQELMG
jgi:DegV family protein with EDD domain